MSEPAVDRYDVNTIVGALSDRVADVRRIRELLEGELGEEEDLEEED